MNSSTNNGQRFCTNCSIELPNSACSLSLKGLKQTGCMKYISIKVGLRPKSQPLSKTNDKDTVQLQYVSILGALSVLFPSRSLSSIPNTEELFMCNECGTVLSTLFGAYFQLLSLSKVNATVTELIRQIELWHNTRSICNNVSAAEVLGTYITALRQDFSPSQVKDEPEEHEEEIGMDVDMGLEFQAFEDNLESYSNTISATSTGTGKNSNMFRPPLDVLEPQQLLSLSEAKTTPQDLNPVYILLGPPFNAYVPAIQPGLPIQIPEHPPQVERITSIEPATTSQSQLHTKPKNRYIPLLPKVQSTTTPQLQAKNRSGYIPLLPKVQAKSTTTPQLQAKTRSGNIPLLPKVQATTTPQLQRITRSGYIPLLPKVQCTTSSQSDARSESEQEDNVNSAKQSCSASEDNEEQISKKQGYRRHEDPDRLACKINGCYKTFLLRWELDMHILQVHQNISPKKCAQCGFNYYDDKFLEAHHCMKKTKELSRRCNYCGMYLNSSSTWSTHKRTHEEGRFRCPAKGCKRHYFKSSELLNHVKKKHKVKNRRPLRRRTRSKTVLNNKSDDYDDEIEKKPNVYCTEQVSVFPIQNPSDILISNIQSVEYDQHKKFICSVEGCNRRFRSAYSLNTHIGLMHKGTPKPKVIHDDSSKINCTFEGCKRVFLRQLFLDKHISIAHSGRPKKLVEKGPCPECGKLLSRGAIREHLASVHSDEKNQVCHKCGKCFKTAYVLKRHMYYKHSSVRRYKCPLCGVSFKGITEIRNHWKGKIHSPEETSELLKSKVVRNVGPDEIPILPPKKCYRISK